MKKLLSTFLMTALAGSMFAYNVFIDPAVTEDGEWYDCWEDAVSPAGFSLMTNSLQDGDTLFIKGGVYRLSSVNERWLIKKSVVIIAGLDPSLKGTDVTRPAYPSKTPTIFDGDINKNGKPDKGDAPALLRVDFSDKELGEGEITIQGVTFRNTYNDNPEEATKDLQTYLADCSALRLICGTAFMKNCEFYNHRSPINRGSQCVTSVGCNMHLTDCSLHDCTSMSRGALIRMRSYFIGGVESNPFNGDCVLERCVLYNANNMGGEAMNVEGEYGGAVHASTGRCFAINTTFACDTSYSKGGAIRPNGDGLWLISCTFVNNIAVRCNNTADPANKPNTYGSALGMDHDTKFAVANTIILDDIDTYSKRYTPVYADDNTVQSFSGLCTTGGNNLLGTFWLISNSALLDQSDFWLATDHPTLNKTSVNKFSDYFGTISNFKDNGGGTMTILPLKMQNGDNVAHLQQLANEWCPEFTKVDASKDQRGFTRDANITCIGAAAFEAEAPSKLWSVNANLWEDGTMYNVLGQPVDDNYRGIVIKNGKKIMLQ